MKRNKSVLVIGAFVLMAIALLVPTYNRLSWTASAKNYDNHGYYNNHGHKK